MSTQIANNGVSLKITTNNVPKYITKSSILTVHVLTGSVIKIDIGKGALYNIYVNQQDVTAPASTDASDLRDQIIAMLQPTGASGGDASAANQLAQTAELQSIRSSIAALNTTVTGLNTGMGTLNATVNTINDKVFYEPKLVDETAGNVIYRGFALPGTRPTDHTWAIQRVTNENGSLSYHWANGDKNFDKSWENRAAYSYS